MEYYMNRCWLNNVCVSRGLKAQQFHGAGHEPDCLCDPAQVRGNALIHKKKCKKHYSRARQIVPEEEANLQDAK